MDEDEARLARLNDFARSKHPGMVGVRLTRCDTEEVTGELVVTDEVIAGTGVLWAPVVITLADWLCAAGTPLHMPEAASGFTTVELKTNFLGTAAAGQRVTGRATTAHVGRTTQVWDAEVRNADTDRAIALFRCTQMILYPKS
ncbi:MAG: PaaI family thioesterase [Myxococcales bacterium]|nr:PaaI family thioesterase [Myxococcales bacterium]